MATKPNQRRDPLPPPDSRSAFRGIGYFHFAAENKAAPEQSLGDALAAKASVEDISNSLIVLPEGFNYRGGYRWQAGEPDLTIDEALVVLSMQFGVAFVAGLMEPAADGSHYNSSVLIDGPYACLLSRKEEDDGFRNYRSATYNHAIRYRGLSIGSLVCLDGFRFNPTALLTRHRRLLAALKELGEPRLLCIPACTEDHSTQDIATRWSEYLSVVIANSRHMQPSVATWLGRRVEHGGSASAVEILRLPCQRPFDDFTG